MLTKRSAKDRAAEQADFKAWLADAVAALQRDHNMNPAIIPQRTWRNLYIQGKTPQQAADRAAVSAYNRRSAADRLKRR
jgi:hypothetical protein